jgi:hypothetical protein
MLYLVCSDGLYGGGLIMKISEYEAQLEKLSWHSVPAWIWLMIQNMGLDEEFESYQQDEWIYCELSLNYQDEADLRMLDEKATQKFNDLNDLLKANNQTVLIDHDNGKVFVVRLN